MKQIFHHYDLWEDYKYDFYNNCSGNIKEEKIKKVIELFNSEELTRYYMSYIINNWKYSCEHNLTNPSINKIAYIGQCACAMYARVPNTVTMFAWNLLDEHVRSRANKIAQECLDLWNNNNKNIQTCLNIY